MTKYEAETLCNLIDTLRHDFSVRDMDSQILKAVVHNTALATVKELIKDYSEGKIGHDVIQGVNGGKSE